MYTQFYRRRDKTQASPMAPRKASKANVEVSGQSLDNVSDTFPRSINSVLNWSYVSDILQAELVDYSDDSDDKCLAPSEDREGEMERLLSSLS
jgi:hypothetical protein